MVAIPDFAAGAMENYGLVTYREAALLFDEKVSAAANKQRVGNLLRSFYSMRSGFVLNNTYSVHTSALKSEVVPTWSVHF